MQNLFAENNFFCPICDRDIEQSSKFSSRIAEPKACWLANMVRHYRLYHIPSWLQWCENENYKKKGWLQNFDKEKLLVNERAKRQIIRKCRSFLLYHEMTPETFRALHGTLSKTIKLADKLLLETNYKKIRA